MAIILTGDFERVGIILNASLILLKSLYPVYALIYWSSARYKIFWLSLRIESLLMSLPISERSVSTICFSLNKSIEKHIIIENVY